MSKSIRLSSYLVHSALKALLLSNFHAIKRHQKVNICFGIEEGENWFLKNEDSSMVHSKLFTNGKL